MSRSEPIACLGCLQVTPHMYLEIHVKLGWGGVSALGREANRTEKERDDSFHDRFWSDDSGSRGLM